jgi:hypothetical protein
MRAGIHLLICLFFNAVPIRILNKPFEARRLPPLPVALLVARATIPLFALNKKQSMSGHSSASRNWQAHCRWGVDVLIDYIHQHQDNTKPKRL